MNSLSTYRILGEQAAFSLVVAEPGVWHIISIRPASGGGSPLDNVSHLAAGILRVYIDDCCSPDQEVPGVVRLASFEDVAAVLEWTREHERLLFHCQCGASRSAALAYVVGCSRMAPEQAVKLLSPLLHRPNRHLIQLGARILGTPRMLDVVAQYYGDTEFGCYSRGDLP